MSLPITNALDHFLDLCCADIERRAELAETETAVLRSGAVAFRRAISTTRAEPETLATSHTTVPVVGQMQHLSPSLIGDAAVAAVTEIPWIPSPRLESDDGAEVALGIVNDVRDLGDVSCGLVLLAPGAAYPEHSHPPQEIYLPIAGDGRWRHGGNVDYRLLATDALVYNAQQSLHGTVAGNEPLLSLFILWP